MRLYPKLIAIAIASVAFWLACSENTTNPDDQNKTATLKVSLTDASAAFDAVNITFSEISVHIDSEWVIIRGEPITVNLLEWTNGKTIELGSAEVQLGDYTQIPIKIDDAEVVVDGQSHVLVVPSGAQTGLKPLFRLRNRSSNPSLFANVFNKLRYSTTSKGKSEA